MFLAVAGEEYHPQATIWDNLKVIAKKGEMRQNNYKRY